LEWLPSQTDAQDATSISTFPLDDVSPHFAFRHGYLEIVAREAPFASGVWPAIVMYSDETALAAALPPNFTPYLPTVEMDVLEFYGPSSTHPSGGEIGTLKENYANGRLGGYTSENYPATVNVTQPHTYGWLWKGGPQWNGGQVCQYIDNVLQGCQPTSAASEAQQMFLVVGMGVGCNYVVSDRSCLNGLSRADFLVSRVTVFGE
jgi:Glycosyl hydrolases family 16